MENSQNSEQQNGQNKGTGAQLSWSQPFTSPAQRNTEPSKQPPMGSDAVRPAAASASAPVNGSTPASQAKSNTVRNVAIGVVALVIIGGIGWALTGNKKTPAPVATTDTSNTTKAPALPMGAAEGSASSSTDTQPLQNIGQATFPGGKLAIQSPQNAGLAVAVTDITVQVPTWVVIYESYNGQPGNVLGAALFTQDRSSGVVDLLRGTLPGQTYFAGEARDDGDHMFSKVNDPAIRNTDGDPIVLKFQTK